MTDTLAEDDRTGRGPHDGAEERIALANPPSLESLVDEIEIFHGQLSPIAARLYVRIATIPGGSRWSIAGFLRGPAVRQANSLPVTAPLVDQGRGESLLGCVSLPDPCYWSSELPALYHLQIELRQDGELLSTTDREIGFRCLGVEAGDLRLHRRRWVLRGVGPAPTIPPDFEEFRSLVAAAVLDNPDLETCRRASRVGVLVVARLSGEHLSDRMRQLASCPAVGIVLLGGDLAITDEIQSAAANVLLGQFLPAPRNIEPADWANVVFCEVGEDGLDVTRLGRCGQPVVAVRRSRPEIDLPAARRECDTLQRDLAPQGDFAGYVIISAEWNSDLK